MNHPLLDTDVADPRVLHCLTLRGAVVGGKVRPPAEREMSAAEAARRNAEAAPIGSELVWRPAAECQGWPTTRQVKDAAERKTQEGEAPPKRFKHKVVKIESWEETI